MSRDCSMCIDHRATVRQPSSILLFCFPTALKRRNISYFLENARSELGELGTQGARTANNEEPGELHPRICFESLRSFVHQGMYNAFLCGTKPLCHDRGSQYGLWNTLFILLFTSGKSALWLDQSYFCHRCRVA